MAERWGPRPESEIEKEPPKENPIHVPSDAIGDDITGSNDDVGDQSGDDTSVPNDQTDAATPPEVGQDLETE